MSEHEDGKPLDGLDQQAFSRWVKEQFDNMARHAAENGLFDTDRLEGRPVWAIPHQAFIGRIWQIDSTANAYWIISGVFHTDHIPVSVAPTVREAARHFALKWQMQSARLEGDDAEPAGEANWTGIGENLVEQAEALYALVERDEIWANVRDDA